MIENLTHIVAFILGISLLNYLILGLPNNIPSAFFGVLGIFLVFLPQIFYPIFLFLLLFFGFYIKLNKEKKAKKLDEIEIRNCENAIKDSANNHEAYGKLGEIYERKGDFIRAMEYYNYSFKIYPAESVKKKNEWCKKRLDDVDMVYKIICQNCSWINDKSRLSCINCGKILKRNNIKLAVFLFISLILTFLLFPNISFLFKYTILILIWFINFYIIYLKRT